MAECLGITYDPVEFEGGKMLLLSISKTLNCSKQTWMKILTNAHPISFQLHLKVLLKVKNRLRFYFEWDVFFTKVNCKNVLQ